MWGDPHLSIDHIGIHTQARAHLKSGPTVEPRETGFSPFLPTFSVPVSSLRLVPFMVADSGAVCFNASREPLPVFKAATTSALYQAHSCTHHRVETATMIGDTTTKKVLGSSICSLPGSGLSLSWPTTWLPGSRSLSIR